MGSAISWASQAMLSSRPSSLSGKINGVPSQVMVVPETGRLSAQKVVPNPSRPSVVRCPDEAMPALLRWGDRSRLWGDYPA